jgi:hypothetical protein
LKKPFTKKGLVEWFKVKALSLSPSTEGKRKKEKKKNPQVHLYVNNVFSKYIYWLVSCTVCSMS